MHRWLPLPTVLVTLLFASQAFAAPMELVTYNMSSSSITLSAPGFFDPVSIPPQGTLSGKVEIAYTSDNAQDILNGPAILESVNLSGSLNISTNVTLPGFAGPITLTGPAQGQLDAPVSGTVSGSNGTTGTGATISFGANQGTFSGSTTITCGLNATVCGILNPSGPMTFSGTGTGPIPDLTLGSIHGDFTSFGFALGLPSALTVDFTLGGQVIAMQPIPEPSSVLLLAGGLAGLVLRRRFRAPNATR